MEIIERPVIPYLLYRWFGIETKSYKAYWKCYCNSIQKDLEESRTNPH